MAKCGRKKGSIPWNKGKQGTYHIWPNGRPAFSEATRKKIGDAGRGRPSWNKGKPYLAIRGRKNPNWKGGVTSKDQTLRSRIEFKLWKKAVFAKLPHVCVLCGSEENLIAHHKKEFKDHPKLRYVVSNGQIVCRSCHCKIHRPKRKYV